MKITLEEHLRNKRTLDGWFAGAGSVGGIRLGAREYRRRKARRRIAHRSRMVNYRRAK